MGRRKLERGVRFARALLTALEYKDAVVRKCLVVAPSGDSVRVFLLSDQADLSTRVHGVLCTNEILSDDSIYVHCGASSLRLLGHDESSVVPPNREIFDRCYEPAIMTDGVDLSAWVRFVL